MIQYYQITTIIAELLHKHDCVIVPDFGGFVARNFSSNFSKGNNLLYPQAKHVIFNKNLIHNDGLLISALMKKNNSSLQEATKKIEDYKDYVLSLLTVKKRFELTNIGLLYIDNENNLRFEAKVDVNFLLDSFGLEPVIANELVFEPQKQLVTNVFEDRRTVVELPVPRKKSYRKLVALALGLPITMSFLLFAAYSKPMKPILESSINPFYSPEKTYSPKKQINHKAIFINPVQQSSLLVDANGYATFKLSEYGNVLVASERNDFEVLTTNDANYSVIHSKSSEYNFQVVVGCFGIEENAQKLVRELKSQQLDGYISGLNKKGLHVVSCGKFNNKEKANLMLSSIRANYPNAWIMSK
jgi:hypothetical protein